MNNNLKEKKDVQKNRIILWELAEPQAGYFTIKQAKEKGVRAERVAELASRNGWLEYIDYGLYRIELMPYSSLDEYFKAMLWPNIEIGILSYKTALDIYDVCDINPFKNYITVSKSFRTSRELPDDLEIIKENLDEKNIRRYQGLNITTLYKTILTCYDNGTTHDLLEEAIDNGYKKGLLTLDEILGINEITGLAKSYKIEHLNKEKEKNQLDLFNNKSQKEMESNRKLSNNFDKEMINV